MIDTKQRKVVEIRHTSVDPGDHVMAFAELWRVRAAGETPGNPLIVTRSLPTSGVEDDLALSDAEVCPHRARQDLSPFESLLGVGTSRQMARTGLKDA